MERLFELPAANPQGQHADAPWVMAYSHKTQSFMKNGGQQKCLDKALAIYVLYNIGPLEGTFNVDDIK